MRIGPLSISLTSVISLLIPSVSGHSRAREAITYISEVEDVAINTKSGLVDHLTHFDLTFYLHERKQRVKLNLEPNHNILAEDAQINYLDRQGNIRHSELIVRGDHKVFKGTAWVDNGEGHWVKVGWARIYLLRDGHKPLMEGALSILGDHHTIQLRSNYAQVKRSIDVDVDDRREDSMIAHRDSDIGGHPAAELKRDSGINASCGADDLAFNLDLRTSLFSAPEAKRQSSGSLGAATLRASIGDTTGCPTEGRVALIGIATDCGYTASFTDEAAVRQNIINVVNSASDVYERTFNITIGLRNITISDASCPSTAPQSAQWNLPCSNAADISERLDLFSQWRGALGDDNAYWTLLSTCPTSSAVGLAWLGQLCVTGVSGFGDQSATGANFVARTSSEWQVFAHESGHTFGAVHDCDSSACAGSGASQCCPISTSGCDANGQYLMSPVSGRGLTDFSPCTIGNICSNIGKARIENSCLVPNRNLTTITGSQCGNGIVESGEDCDADNACCDPTTCKFRDTAVCDDANDACCTSCQFTAAGTVCRASTGTCDIEETCSGRSSTCPTDDFLPNGQSCGGNSTGLVCASGQCTSRDLQCQAVINPFTNANFTDACDTTACTLTCQSAQNTCASMQQDFLDGTPCGTSGSCSSGRCRNSNNDDDSSDDNPFTGDVSSWFDRHRNLVIGLSAGLGSLIILILACCIFSCCRKRKQRRATLPPPPVYMGQPWQSGPHPGYTYPVPAYMPQNQDQSQRRAPMVRYA